MLRETSRQSCQSLHRLIVMASVAAVSDQLVGSVIVEEAHIRNIPVSHCLLLTCNDLICECNCHLIVIRIFRCLIKIHSRPAGCRRFQKRSADTVRVIKLTEIFHMSVVISESPVLLGTAQAVCRKFRVNVFQFHVCQGLSTCTHEVLDRLQRRLAEDVIIVSHDAIGPAGFTGGRNTVAITESGTQQPLQSPHGFFQSPVIQRLIITDLIQQLKQRVSTLRSVGGHLSHITGIMPSAVGNNGQISMTNRNIVMTGIMFSRNLASTPLTEQEIQGLPDRILPHIGSNGERTGYDAAAHQDILSRSLDLGEIQHLMNAVDIGHHIDLFL